LYFNESSASDAAKHEASSNAIMNCCVQVSAEASHGHETDAGVAILISPAGLA